MSSILRLETINLFKLKKKNNNNPSHFCLDHCEPEQDRIRRQ